MEAEVLSDEEVLNGVSITAEDKELVQELTSKYIDEQHLVTQRRVNRAFAILMGIEWLFGILTALFVSPQTWSGGSSSVHIHVWSSLLLGGAILMPPIAFAMFRSDNRWTPYVTACSQMLFGSLLIHLMAGRLEAHFYIFGSLAFLATYRNWKVLIPATVVVAVDHIVRGIYWPQSVYGVLSGAEWLWIEHAAWVLFEDVFLIYSIVQGTRDTESIAKTRASLEVRNQKIENLVATLKSKQSQLVQSAKLASLGEMSSGIAHELNNPLHFINGFNNRIKKLFEKNDVVTADMIETYTTQISENCARMKRIVQHFREFSRQADQCFQPFSVNYVVERSFVLFSEQLRLKGISTELNLADENPYVSGDSNRIEQVFINLIGNARDALEGREGSVIKVRVASTDENVLIQFEDNGPGVDPEVAEKIFNPFFTTKEVGKGTGLGLSISHTIISEHKGKMECLPSAGGGAIFRIEIPIYHEAAMDQVV